jgi:hypothetical protein
MLALLTVGIATASSASAAFKLEAIACVPGKPAFCWEAKTGGVGLQELVGEEEFKITQLATPEPLLEAVLGGETVHIQCKEATGSGVVLQNAPLTTETTGEKIKIKFTGCALLETLGSKCKVPATIETKELAAKASTVSDLIIEPAIAEGIFAEIKFENITEGSCPATIRGSQPVKGKAECLWLEEASLVDLEGQECEVIHEDGGLKLGGSAASLLAEFEILFPILEETDNWDVVEA